MSYTTRGLGQTSDNEVTAQVCPPECPPGHPSLEETEPEQAGMDYSLSGKGGAMLGWFVGLLMTAAALDVFIPEK